MSRHPKYNTYRGLLWLICRFWKVFPFSESISFPHPLAWGDKGFQIPFLRTNDPQFRRTFSIILKRTGMVRDSVPFGNFLELPSKIPWCWIPTFSYNRIDYHTSQAIVYAFTTDIRPPLLVCGKAPHRSILSNVKDAITCAYIWSVRDRSRGLNPNMFLCSGNCFARLRQNSLPVSVVFHNKENCTDKAFPSSRVRQGSCSNTWRINCFGSKSQSNAMR